MADQRLALARHFGATNSETRYSEDEVNAGLTALVDHLGPRDWMHFRHGTFVVPTGEEKQPWPVRRPGR